MTRVRVRAFAPADAAEVAALLRASFEAAYAGLVPRKELDAHIASVSAAGVISAVERRAADGGTTYVAQAGRAVIGYAGAGPSRDEDRDPAVAAELYALYVDPASFGIGAGRALQRACLEDVRMGGARTADVWVLGENERAIRFYRSTGWTPDGRRRVIGDFLGGVQAVRSGRMLPVVREMRPDADARAVAEVHVQAWRDAYRGQMPDAFLDGLSVDVREAFWQQQQADVQTFVAEHAGEVVGFVSAGPSRDAGAPPWRPEVYALNVVATAWGTGAGLALLRTAERALAGAGAREATLWVLATNERARGFYEREGWIADGATKTDDAPGFALDEVRYRKLLLPTAAEV